MHFRLVAADTAKDNRKDDKERRFVLIDPGTVTRADEAGVSSDAVLAPVAEQDGALVLRFAYRPMPQGTKQAELLDRAAETIMADAAVKARWQDLTARAPTEKNPLRTVLQKHLTDYTAKNTADYFIHKDLGGFLRRELDFYIKNEVMNLDDVQNAATFSAIETQLRTIQTLRTIALDLIGFLAQMEDFQKRLWLKKKFVVAAHYCLTLDRVPEALWPRIAQNARQWSQWRDFGLWQGADGSVTELKTRPALMIDTSLFGIDFLERLLDQIFDLDSVIDGVLIHGDNFQSLKLIEHRYRHTIQCVYIDPPYNASTSEIIYKNGYKHSSWASLMAGRLEETKHFLKETGSVVVAIDENERDRLGLILSETFSSGQVTCVSVIHNPRGIQGMGFSYTNEFAYFIHPENVRLGLRDLPNSKSKPLMKTGGESARATARNCFYPIIIQDDAVIGFGDVPADGWSPARATEAQANGSRYVWPISSSDGMERKWRYARQSVEEVRQKLEVKKGRNQEPVINLAKDKESYRTVWTDAEFNAAEYGSTLLKNIIPEASFSFPKSLYTVCHSLVVTNVGKLGYVLDYFAGSGTTGHAVISLNRNDGGRRRYILVEQGLYFDTVLKPRIQKVVFSRDWSDGRPSAPETGISHGFKILKIESYEDTLNNLTLVRTPGQASLLDTLSPGFRDDYLLRYMMDVETRGSLLSIRDFRKPFDYKLRIAVDSAGAAEERPVDLLETFNYLIGLTVRTIGLHLDRGFATVTGVLPDRQTALILWRDCDTLDYDGLLDLCKTLGINPADNTHDIVYVNGDHIIPTMATADDAAGGGTKTIRIRQIEPVFLDAMFSIDDAA